MSDHHLTDIPLAGLDIPESLRHGIEATGFKFCTPIQAKTLPLALAGVDVAGQAQTGTGKTAAYLLATFNRLLKVAPEASRKVNQPRALILAPTRELAIQIYKDAELLGQFTGLRTTVVYGGEGYDTQRKCLEEGVDILIGTPGRLLDYYKQHVFDLKAIEVMVVDEADRMFDLGFIKDLRFVFRRLPKPEKRLSMLFSATLSLRVTELAYEHMNNPQLVQIETSKATANKVREIAYYPANKEKIPLLIGLFKQLKPHRSMIFVNTKRAADELNESLEANGFKAAILSGDVPQKKRLSLLGQFQDGELPILVATDVAARGLHIAGVSHVFNFDLPQDAEDYVHRIGRTARAGESGDAISFVCETYAFSLPDIEAYIGHPIPSAKVTPDLLAAVITPAARARTPQKSSTEWRPAAALRSHARARPWQPGDQTA